MVLRKQRKLHNKRGFTLAETLLAVLILLLVATVVATGIPAAKNAYEKVVLASNAEVLLSTTISSLRNELGTARDITMPGGTLDGNTNTITGRNIRYYNTSRGTYSEIFVANANTEIMIKKSGADGIGTPSVQEKLIPSKIATEKLYVSFESVSYNKNGIVTFNNLCVKRESGSNIITKRDEFSIRVITG